MGPRLSPFRKVLRGSGSSSGTPIGATEPCLATPGEAPPEHTFAGRSVLLAGRMLAIGINFMGQVLLVRYLSTRDYGVWVYALSIAAFFHGSATLGLDKVIDRFVPIYHEQQNHGRALRLDSAGGWNIFATGVAIIGTFYLFPDYVSALISDEAPYGLILIVVFLIPLDALDTFLIALFATFAEPRAIFFRKHVLGPGLKLAVVLTLVSSDADVTFLAYGYLMVSALIVLLYSALLVRLLKQQGVLDGVRFADITVPVREIVGFSAPLVSSEMLSTLLHSSHVLLLGYFWEHR